MHRRTVGVIEGPAWIEHRSPAVLVVESNVGAGVEAIEELRSAGHGVHTCFEDDMEAFPCRALFADPAGVVEACERARTARAEGGSDAT